MKILRLIPLLMFVSCVTFKPQFANFKTVEPQQIVDSIYNSVGIKSGQFDLWDKTMFVGSDSVITTQFISYQKVDKRVIIISVIQKSNDSVFNVKYRKE